MLNLELYFKRIGFQDKAKPDLATLNALSFAHITYIPFENISVLNKEAISLEPADLFDKLVKRQRGGYCFEQNGLFLAVLEQIGFEVAPLAGRVRLACKSREELPMRTHFFLKVNVDGKSYIANPDGSRATIYNTKLTRRQKNGEKQEQELGNQERLNHALQQYFGLVTPNYNDYFPSLSKI